MRLNRKWMLAIALVLSMSMAIGGTMAYLSDTAVDTNVMTLGSVKIEQHEYERVLNADGTYKTDTIDGQTSYVLKPFTQGKPLYPATEQDANGQPYNYGAGDYDTTRVRMSQVDSHGSMDVFVNKNAQDKFVTVENTGKSDAYVRTLIAFELGKLPAEQFDNVIRTSSFMTDQNVWNAKDIGKVEIDGNNYLVVEYIYNGAKILGGVHENGILPKGDTTYPSLAQVYMTATATNEDCEAIDGNGNGTYDILVLSQAMQVEGFDKAETALKAGFGEATVENAAKWFGGVVPAQPVATAAELAAALATGGEIYLSDDITVTSTMNVPAGMSAKINLSGYDLSYAVTNSGAAAIINNKGTLELSGTGTISFVAANPDLGAIPSYATNTITNTGTLIINEGVTITNGSDGGASYAVDVQSGKCIINGGELKGDRCALRIARFNADTEFVMNGGIVSAKTPAWIHLPGSNANNAPKISVTINDGTFESTKESSADNNVLYTYSYGDSHANTSVTINGGKFLKGTVSIGSGYKGDVPTLKIKGGTFDYDVMQWLENSGSKVLYSANN